MLSDICTFTICIKFLSNDKMFEAAVVPIATNTRTIRVEFRKNKMKFGVFSRPYISSNIPLRKANLSVKHRGNKTYSAAEYPYRILRMAEEFQTNFFKFQTCSRNVFLILIHFGHH
jgi:hypothetical protein